MLLDVISDHMATFMWLSAACFLISRGKLNGLNLFSLLTLSVEMSHCVPILYRF